METSKSSENNLNPLNLIVLVLSVYVLLALIVDTIFTVPQEIGVILDLVDNGICIFFLIEFAVRFYKAENKLKFMKWGWIDLISSIPNVDFFKSRKNSKAYQIIKNTTSFSINKAFGESCFSKQGSRSIHNGMYLGYNSNYLFFNFNSTI